ncbi:MAG: flagellar motor protein MotB [Gammaproteobacteria bacterium]
MPEAGQPIIIKKIKKGGHGHHGGAWKVAFADFVTAMMAFFLLLWLLGSTTEAQKRGISDYFENPSGPPGEGGASTAAVNMDGGLDAPSSQGENFDAMPAPGDIGSGKQSLEDIDADSLEEEAKAAEREKLEQLKKTIEEAIAASEQLAQFKDQLLLDITSEGLRVQIVDKEGRPMFDSGSSKLKDYTRDILRMIVTTINDVPNKISLSGHTDRTPFASKDGYSNWELSADRANAARRELVAAGLPDDKLGRVVGLSSSVLFDKQNPFNPINRRISIIVMNKAAEEELSHEGGPVVSDGGADADGLQGDVPAEGAPASAGEGAGQSAGAQGEQAEPAEPQVIDPPIAQVSH